jgi:hypothetical protein
VYVVYVVYVMHVFLTTSAFECTIGSTGRPMRWAVKTAVFGEATRSHALRLLQTIRRSAVVRVVG